MTAPTTSASLTDAELDARLGELLKQHPDEHQVFYFDKLVESLGGEGSGVSVSKNAVKKRIVALRKGGDSPTAKPASTPVGTPEGKASAVAGDAQVDTARKDKESISGSAKVKDLSKKDREALEFSRAVARLLPPLAALIDMSDKAPTLPWTNASEESSPEEKLKPGQVFLIEKMEGKKGMGVRALADIKRGTILVRDRIV